MPQIRKFEQDAIVDTTLATIIADRDEVIAKLKLTPEYVGIKQRLDSIRDLNKQSKAIDDKVGFERKDLENIVEAFNEDVLNQNPIYKLEYNRYSYGGETGLKFNTECSSYSKAGQAIQNEIAIALLPKDAVNDINSIIERIADKFKIVLGGS
jgi:protein subunit release factor A